jgi:putative addiction module component (TIGR02574 family)
MNNSVEHIIEQALQIPPKERAIIAERLISSLEREVDFEVEAAWQKEVQQRIADVDNGNAVCIPWEEAKKLLRNETIDKG